MEEVRKELERIYKRDGALTATAVLKEAAQKGSPLHEHFTWDDSEAAQQWRLVQARNLIKRVKVISPAGTEERIIHVPSITRGEGEYQVQSVVASQPDKFERAMASARADLEAAEESVGVLNSLKKNKKLTDAGKMVSKARKLVEEVRPDA